MKRFQLKLERSALGSFLKSKKWIQIFTADILEQSLYLLEKEEFLKHMGIINISMK